MNQNRYRSFFHDVSEIVTLYVGLLALIGLLASVGFFKLRVEPTLKMLDPVYIFDMPQLIRAFNSYAQGSPLPQEWRAVSNGFAVFRKPYGKDLAGGRLVSSAMVPFQDVTGPGPTNFPSWAHPSDPQTLFYHLGLTNAPATYSATHPNFSVRRTDDEKRYGVDMGIIMDYVRLAVAKGGTPPDHVNENPLDRLQAVVPHKDAPQVGDMFQMDPISEATLPYSIASIGNLSSEPIENVRVSVASSIWSAPVELVGWSDLPQLADATQKGHNHHITIERLEPGQSIEIVFRGHKLLRANEVSVVCSWIFDKTKIAVLMALILVLTIAVYYGDILSLKFSRLVGSRKD